MQMSTTAAVITGGASGLGEATARHFATQGAKVTLLDRDATRGAQVAAQSGRLIIETEGDRRGICVKRPTPKLKSKWAD